MCRKPMTDAIATVTATVEGEQVETESDVNRGTLTSLLGSIFENEDVAVVVHEIHNDDQIEDIKSRYADRWNARVEMDTDNDESNHDGETYGFNPIVALETVICPDCGFAEVATTDATGHYQCSDCLNRYTASEATIVAAGDDPREEATDYLDAYGAV